VAAGRAARPRNASPHQLVALAPSTGEVVAYGALRTNRMPWARLDLMVDPAYRRRGVGGRLLAALQDDLRALGAVSVHARVRADVPEALTFLARRGFAERHRMHGLRLALDDVSYEALRRHERRALAAGYAIVALAEEMASGRDWRARLRALADDATIGWPDPDPAPAAPMTAERFAQWIEPALAAPDMLFLATAGDRLVGFASVTAVGTAVHPDHRGRGVATALKARALADAKRRRRRWVETCTAQPAMLAVNEKLGYVRHQVEVRLLKLFPDPTAAGGDRGADLPWSALR
jgi:GNAT superfamily N-acetyltransferase